MANGRVVGVGRLLIEEDGHDLRARGVLEVGDRRRGARRPDPSWLRPAGGSLCIGIITRIGPMPLASLPRRRVPPHEWGGPLPLASRHLAQPGQARPRMAGEGLPVHRDQAEGRRVAERPLEVVEQRPVEVRAHVDPFGEARQDLAHRGVDVGDPLFVVTRSRSRSR